MKTPDIKALPFVCRDEGSSSWHYDVKDDCYYRLYGGGDYSKIYGKYLPNPDDLWNRRIDRIKSSKGKTDIYSVKPSDATFALYNHRKMVVEKN